MSYCSRSCWRRFTVLNFKSWAFSRICGHCQQHFTAHAQKRGYLGTSGKSFGDLATFSVDFFAFYKLKVRRISTSVLFYLLRQVWSWYGHPLPSYCVLAADTLRDLATLWPWPALIHGGSRGQHRQKVRRSYALSVLELWAITSSTG